MSCGIYKFENNINHKVYIGQAIDLKERYKKHCKNIKDINHQEDLYQALREYGLQNFSYNVLEEYEFFDQDLLNQKEKYYINLFNSLKPNGYNMIPGGTNGAGLAKGKAVQQFSLTGEKLNEFYSAHEAARQTGIDYSSICSCCRKEQKFAKGYQWKWKEDNEQIIDISANINNQLKVYQYNKDTNVLIRVYENLTEASKQTGYPKSAICNVCNYKNKSAYGYIWRYENKPYERQFQKKNTKKKVAQYDLNQNLIKIFNSLTEAAKETNTNLGNLGQVCSGKRKTANGYIWKYI